MNQDDAPNKTTVCHCPGGSTYGTADPTVRLCDLCGGTVAADPATGDYVRRDVVQQTTAPTPGEVIAHIARVAHAIGWQAGVGASETAGTIVSVLAANPHIVDRFMSEGVGLFIDGPVDLNAVNGCLTYLAQSGEILSPAELHRRSGGKMQ